MKTALPAATAAFVLAGLMALPHSASAQYIEYSDGKPSVEIYSDPLNELAPPPPRRAAAPLPVQEDAGRIKLIPPSQWGEMPKALYAEEDFEDEPDELDDLPLPVTEAPQRRVLKPVFTGMPPLPEEEEIAAAQPPEDRAPVALPTRPHRKLIAQSPAAPAVEEEKEPPAAAIRRAPPVMPADDVQPPPPLFGGNDEEIPPLAAVPSPGDLTISFSGNESDIGPAIAQKLAYIAQQLADLPDTRLQVRAYATGEDGNTSSARRISLSRALSVRSYLMDNGIKPNRVDVRALGSETDRTPLDRVDMVFVR